MIPYVKTAKLVIVTGAGAVAAVDRLYVDPVTDDVCYTRFIDCHLVDPNKYARIMRRVANDTGRPSIIAPLNKGRAMAMIAVADLHILAPDETGRVWLIPTARSVCLPGPPKNPSVGAKPNA